MRYKEIVYEYVDWVYLGQDGDQWRAFINVNETSGYIKGEEF
jgi:hypothetical protein